MSKSNTDARVRKPHPDFPLTPHPTGRWCKKVKGKLVYFGHVKDDLEGKAALAKWLKEKDYLLNGITPPQDPSGLTVNELVNRFLTAKARLISTGELSERTFRQYRDTGVRVVKHLGEYRIVDALTPSDFGQLRSSLAAGRGPVALGNEITVVRMIFKYAFDEGFLDRPIRYGQSFDKPSRKTLRVERARRGPKLFEASEVRAILDAADDPIRAFVLLGINCAFGSTDIANLPKSAIDLEGRWIDYARGKTGIERRIPLWPETIAAVRDAIAQRPKPKDKADEGLAFLTRFGSRWLKLNRSSNGGPIDADFRGASPDDAIGKEFKKLLVTLGIKRAGLGFYGLRHTFRTVADEAKDQPAAGHIMGHHDTSMAAVYRERIGDDRLLAVVNTVREWLFPADAKPAKGHERTRPAKLATTPKSQAGDDRLAETIQAALAGDGDAQQRLVATWGGKG